ncbi:potassium transporter TrkA [Ketobacter sp. MCCC 1A13808]|uniref:potassium channel family protein n=1 Tax=Ketobacter sp. MCCC 1A13808 TaxID=2602738 RepID=UPI000F22531E|nr:potassium channel protein [Ketobacter sp. MCCC 1A13808]MVF12857.1 potassium transporter TrkA [Ketobacter sp. MCCC 1A13808]RLP54469.1 MAG: potassium channel protein [Ketobacter sp.]
MNYVAYLILRRLRAPLITIIVIYSVSVLGYVLIPGKDPSGHLYHMNFFEAFYFVSYMGSTIGFGELPYEFTALQRFWTLICIYSTVIGWIYSIGAVIAILRDQTFGSLLKRGRFKSWVERTRGPFYLVCGYGLTGRAVVAGLARRGVQTVVIEIDQSRVDTLELDNHPFDIPILCGDASDPDVLRDAGIDHSNCIGTLCLTNEDHVNLYIALASKLLNPSRLVLSRVASREYAGNLSSFGTDHVVDPFETFAEYLTNAVVYPYRQLVYNWLISPKHRSLRTLMKPEKGRWIICGYGRLGQAIQKRFENKGLETVIIEPEPEARNIHEDYRVVKGLGTEAPTLLEAGIHNAVGIVAGTADDANNLSIVLTARELKSSLKLVARQNRNSNTPVFSAAKVDMIMDPNMIIAQRIMALLKSPLLVRFFEEIQTKNEAWCEQLVQKFDELVQDKPLEAWTMSVTKDDMTAIYDVLRMDQKVPVSALFAHPQDSAVTLCGMPLMILRNDQVHLLPEDHFLLRIEDKVLFCGLPRVERQMQWAAFNRNVLRYVLSGSAEDSGLLWQRLFRKKA